MDVFECCHGLVAPAGESIFCGKGGLSD
jgi:hypothetical protein